jgi:hypothetical protein
MNEKLTSKMTELAADELESDESVISALLGDLMVDVKISMAPGDALGGLTGLRNLGQAFADNGMPLPKAFAIALTPRRMLIFKLGTSGRPKRFVGAVDFAKVSNIEVHHLSMKRRMGTITLASGDKLPVRVYPKGDPDGFPESFATVAHGSPGETPAA